MFVLSLLKLDFHVSLTYCTNVKYQIDWNKVAHDPILSQEITNGQAAYMRYSRFKKQIEGTAPVRRPHKNNSGSPSSSPKKARAKKRSTRSLRRIKTEIVEA